MTPQMDGTEYFTANRWVRGFTSLRTRSRQRRCAWAWRWKTLSPRLLPPVHSTIARFKQRFTKSLHRNRMGERAAPYPFGRELRVPVDAHKNRFRVDFTRPFPAGAVSLSPHKARHRRGRLLASHARARAQGHRGTPHTCGVYHGRRSVLSWLAKAPALSDELARPSRCGPLSQTAPALRELRGLLAPLAECPPGASEGDALFVGLLINGTDGPPQISRDMPRRLRSSRCFTQCAHFPGSPFLP